MGLRGRFFSERDLKLVNSFNGELMGDVIQTDVLLFKMCSQQTKTNIYGESSPETGKKFFPGVFITALIDRAEIATEANDFGPDRKQNVVFKMREETLKLVNVYPEVGDLVLFNNRYHEIDNVVQEQFLAGQPSKSLSIIVNTHYARLSKISMVERQK